MSTLDKLLEEFDEEPEKACRLTKRLTTDAASEKHSRSLLLDARGAATGDSYTKQDLEKL